MGGGYLWRWCEIEDDEHVAKILKAISCAGDRYHHTDRWIGMGLAKGEETEADKIEQVVRQVVAELKSATPGPNREREENETDE